MSITYRQVGLCNRQEASRLKEKGRLCLQLNTGDGQRIQGETYRTDDLNAVLTATDDYEVGRCLLCMHACADPTQCGNCRGV